MAKRANNEGTIYKKATTKNGKEYTYWQSQVTVGYDPVSGKRIRKSFTGKTMKEVKEKMQEASVSISNKIYLEPSTMTVADWLNAWLNDYCGHLKYYSRRNYSTIIKNHLIPNIGKIKLSELTAKQIQTLYNKLYTSGHKKKIRGKKTTISSPLSPQTIKNIHGVLCKSLNTAVKFDILKTNPANKATLPKAEQKEIHPLTNDQIQLFLSEIQSSQYRDIYLTILFTGLRISEALGLTWDCIDFQNNTIAINKQLQRRPQADGGYTLAPLKNDKPRTLSAPEFIMDILKSTKKNGSELVFTDQHGNHLIHKNVYLEYKSIASRIGAPDSTVHDLRHTYAVLSLQNGDPIKTIQDNLGHATAAFTLDVYGHTTDKMREDAASRMHDFYITISNDQKHQK